MATLGCATTGNAPDQAEVREAAALADIHDIVERHQNADGSLKLDLASNLPADALAEMIRSQHSEKLESSTNEQSSQVRSASYQEYAEPMLNDPNAAAYQEQLPGNDSSMPELVDADSVHHFHDGSLGGNAAMMTDQWGKPLQINQGMTKPSQTVRLQGSEFRKHSEMASETMIRMRQEKNQLQHHLSIEKNRCQQLQQQLVDEQTSHRQTQNSLLSLEQQNKDMRRMLAKLEVQRDQLIAEKADIERRADEALREIESVLDATLMNSIQQTLKRDSP
ncbi:MAG: hypothetical protein AAFN77_08780 [Planctomycetota bacterium]